MRLTSEAGDCYSLDSAEVWKWDLEMSPSRLCNSEHDSLGVLLLKYTVGLPLYHPRC